MFTGLRFFNLYPVAKLLLRHHDGNHRIVLVDGSADLPAPFLSIPVGIIDVYNFSLRDRYSDTTWIFLSPDRNQTAGLFSITVHNTVCNLAPKILSRYLDGLP